MTGHLADPSFAFRVQTNLYFGAGASLRLPELVAGLGYRRLGLVADAGVVGNSTYQRVREALRTRCDVAHELVNAVAEPDYDYLDQACAEFRNVELSALVAFGGGSTIDLAKGISVLLTNPGPGIAYRGFEMVKAPGVPLVAVPTTAGSGTEVTPNAVFTDKREMRKFGINTALYLPKVAVLDPLLTVSCPRAVTVSSGADAVVHAVESFVARGATPMSRLLSREAFRLAFNALPAVLERPDDVELRGRMQLGAFYAGIALPNAGPGPAGAMSYPLGVHFKVPHGLAGAVFLEPIARLNVTRGCHLYAELYDLTDGARNGLDAATGSAAFCDRLRAWGAMIGLPASLETFGVRREDLPSLADQTFALSGAIEQNPIAVTRRDIHDAFAAIMPGASGR
jgi:alcohol dehydrogenase class IV